MTKKDPFRRSVRWFHVRTPTVTCDDINGQSLQEGVLLCDPGWSVCTAVVEEEAGGEKTDGGRRTSSKPIRMTTTDGFVPPTLWVNNLYICDSTTTILENNAPAAPAICFRV